MNAQKSIRVDQMTTNLIEAAERARDALEQIRDREGGWTYEIAQKAAAKLTAAIEAAKNVEPVGYRIKKKVWIGGDVYDDRWVLVKQPCHGGDPLYTAPPSPPQPINIDKAVNRFLSWKLPEIPVTEYPTRIDICDGKYTVIYDLKTGQSECLRNGSPWRDLCGDKMTLAMFDRIVELEAIFTATQARAMFEHCLQGMMQPVIPDGMRLVPRKLSQPMKDVLTVMLTNCHTVEESYAELLAAAPEAQT